MYPWGLHKSPTNYERASGDMLAPFAPRISLGLESLPRLPKLGVYSVESQGPERVLPNSPFGLFAKALVPDVVNIRNSILVLRHWTW